MVPIALEGRCGPVGLRIVSHQVHTDGVSRDRMVPCNEGVTDPTFAAPFASPLSRQRINDVEARFRDECEIREHVGESDEMMVITAGSALWEQHRWQPEQVFGCIK